MPAQLSLPPADSPEASLANAFAKGDLMVAISEANWRNGLCLAGAKLRNGGHVSLELYLTAGRTYTFVGSGDNDAVDVDLYLWSDAPRPVAEDKEDDGTPIIEWTCDVTDVYRLEVSLVAAAREREFIALSLLSDDGGSLVKEAYQGVAGRFISAAGGLRRSAPGLDWQKGDDQWCVFGFLPVADQGAILNRLTPGAGKTIFAATGSPEFRNINLYLANEKSDTIVSSNEEDNPFPLVRYTSQVSELLDLKIETPRARGGAFLLLGIFH